MKKRKTKESKRGKGQKGYPAWVLAVVLLSVLLVEGALFNSTGADWAEAAELLDVSEANNELRITNYLSAEALAQADELRQAAFELLPKVTFSEWQPLTSKVAFGLTAASELLDVSEPVNALYGSAARIGARLAAGGGK